MGAAALLALLCLAPLARAEEHPLDEQMRRLSVMSQRDEAIADIKYSNVDVRQAAPERAEETRRALMRPLEISGSGMALVTLGR